MDARQPLLEALDPATVVYALAWLGARDLAAFATCSREARDRAHDDVLWRAYVARAFPAFSASGAAPTDGCWRLEAYMQRRASEFQRAYAQGRVGRVSGERPSIHRVSVFDSGAAAARRLAQRIEPVASVASMHDARGAAAPGDAGERRFVRQGTCAWSILGAAPAPGPSSHGAADAPLPGAPAQSTTGHLIDLEAQR